jgi:hypothetical protein
MKSKAFITLLVWLSLSCCLAMPGYAQDSADAATIEPPKYYQVELIVFRHLDQSATTGEIPSMPEAEISDFLEQDLARLQGVDPLTEPPVPEEVAKDEPVATAAAATNRTIVKPILAAADQDNLRLSATAATIERLTAYQLVSYLSWGQTAVDVSVAAPMDLAELGADPDLLSGSIELHQRRYLHLALDITLEGSAGARNGNASYEDSFQIFSRSDALPALKDSRRIRLQSANYFDQPQFGVIAMVSRLAAPAEEAEAMARQ